MASRKDHKEKRKTRKDVEFEYLKIFAQKLGGLCEKP
jgi:hypothetical protein